MNKITLPAVFRLEDGTELTINTMGIVVSHPLSESMYGFIPYSSSVFMYITEDGSLKIESSSKSMTFKSENLLGSASYIMAAFGIAVRKYNQQDLNAGGYAYTSSEYNPRKEV